MARGGAKPPRPPPRADDSGDAAGLRLRGGAGDEGAKTEPPAVPGPAAISHVFRYVGREDVERDDAPSADRVQGGELPGNPQPSGAGEAGGEWRGGNRAAGPVVDQDGGE
jgi:hypothetical protein